jgi:hypothetical protein
MTFELLPEGLLFKPVELALQLLNLLSKLILIFKEISHIFMREPLCFF